MNQTSKPLAIQELLSTIDPAKYQQLVSFARRRLHQVANTARRQQNLASISEEDLVQEAIFKVIIGEEGSRAGRRLKLRNRASPEAFLACLHGIIESILWSHCKAADRRGDHLPAGQDPNDPSMIDPPDPLAAQSCIDRKDLWQVIFERLHQRVLNEPHLLPVLLRWEEGFFTDDRIAANELDRKPAHRIRVLAREILKELAAEISLTPASGKEMIM